MLFIFEIAGVFASFYITRAVLKPEQSTIILSFIVAAANFAGSLAAQDFKAPLTPLQLFLFFKDGLLWPTALPTIAHTLGFSSA